MKNISKRSSTYALSHLTSLSFTASADFSGDPFATFLSLYIADAASAMTALIFYDVEKKLISWTFVPIILQPFYSCAQKALFIAMKTRRSKKLIHGFSFMTFERIHNASISETLRGPHGSLNWINKWRIVTELHQSNIHGVIMLCIVLKYVLVQATRFSWFFQNRIAKLHVC